MNTLILISNNEDSVLIFLAFSGGNNRNGTGEVPDLSSLAGSEEMAGLWAQYHALGLAKGGKATPPAPRDQSVSLCFNLNANCTQLRVVLFLFACVFCTSFKYFKINDFCVGILESSQR